MKTIELVGKCGTISVREKDAAIYKAKGFKEVGSTKKETKKESKKKPKTEEPKE